MYEVEVEHIRLKSGALPRDIRQRFAEARTITHLAHIEWEEHCTECSWPSCYTTCDLYNPRNDGNCRRTIDGFSPVLDAPIYADHVVRVRFRRWGNLTAHCHLALRTVADIQVVERRLNAMSTVAAHVPRLGTAIGRPGLPSRVMRKLKRRSVQSVPRSTGATVGPSHFLIEVYNPSERMVELSFDIAKRGQGIQLMPFKRLLKIEPGFQRVEIGFEEIEQKVAGAQEVDVGINPNILNAEDEGLTLYFGLMTFVRDPAFRASPGPSAPVIGGSKADGTKKVKVVIWDLDNTVWDGTLVEDGPGNVSLRSGVREVIEALDARGIVNSVASKNDEGAATAELERFDLRDYFVFPAIGWGPKSDAVRNIIGSFNVGDDTVAFIDDQPFEREEVRAGNPGVRIYTPEQVHELLSRQEFDVPVTEDGRARRKFYRDEGVRRQALGETTSDYLTFLQQSDIRVHITFAMVERLDRIHELVQRTNQLNFSGNRYSRDDLTATLADPEHESFLVDAADKYGQYGSIGFAVVSLGAVPRVIDFALSCRVQSKRVEHALLTFLMSRYRAHGADDLEIVYNATDRNEQLAQVFPALGCLECRRDGNRVIYRKHLVEAIPDAGPVTVTLQDLGMPNEQLLGASPPPGDGAP